LHYASMLPALAPLLILVACKPPPDQRHHLGAANPVRGRAVIARAGCGACHTIPGIWPQGEMGPALDRVAQQTLLAGRLPNRPDLLAAFIRDAPRLIPGTAMPAMPIREEEARDAAAYLYSLERR